MGTRRRITRVAATSYSGSVTTVFGQSSTALTRPPSASRFRGWKSPWQIAGAPAAGRCARSQRTPGARPSSAASATPRSNDQEAGAQARAIGAGPEHARRRVALLRDRVLDRALPQRAPWIAGRVQHAQDQRPAPRGGRVVEPERPDAGVVASGDRRRRRRVGEGARREVTTEVGEKGRGEVGGVAGNAGHPLLTLAPFLSPSSPSPPERERRERGRGRGGPG